MTHGTSQEGFEAEWRMIQLDTVEGELINHSEDSTKPTSTPRSPDSTK